MRRNHRVPINAELGCGGGGVRRGGSGRACRALSRAVHFVAVTNVDGVRTRRDRGLSGAGDCVLDVPGRRRVPRCGRVRTGFNLHKVNYRRYIIAGESLFIFRQVPEATRLLTAWARGAVSRLVPGRSAAQVLPISTDLIEHPSPRRYPHGQVLIIIGDHSHGPLINQTRKSGSR